MPVTDHAGYLGHAFQGPDAIIEQARQHIGDAKFTTFVGRGLSGALVVPTLAAAFGKSFLIVRKDNENAHSWRRCEGTLGGRWLFVDDLIDSGSTFRATRDAVNSFADACGRGGERFRTTCVGAYLYGSECYPDEFVGPRKLTERAGR